MTKINKDGDANELAVAMKVSAVSIAVNLFLSLFKFLAGILGRSSAMVSDAIHSASDVFSTIIVIIGVRISQKESDKEHPYGHERMESVASMFLAIVLALTGFAIGYEGILKIFKGNYTSLKIPTLLPLIAAIVSIVVKEWMYWYTRSAAKKVNSDALMADAWHHRSDGLSSIGSFVGILGARLGYPVLDPVASVVICLFILKASYDILNESMGKMIDKSCDDETIESMKRCILSDEDVIVLDEIKTRLFGSKMYVEVEIGCDGNLTLFSAHDIAQRVHDSIEKAYPSVKHCMVHVNPEDTKRMLRKEERDLENFEDEKEASKSSE